MNAHPLDAILRRAPDIFEDPVPDGGLRLTRTFPDKLPFIRLLARFLGSRRREVLLDSRGAEFWSFVDGKKSLRTIASDLATRWQLPEPAVHEAVLVYTRSLMLRHLAGLDPANHPTP